MKLTREYSLAPTDDLILFWRSKVTAGRGEGIHVDEIHRLVCIYFI